MQICQSRTCYTILTDRKDKNHLFGKLNHLICSEPCIDSCFPNHELQSFNRAAAPSCLLVSFAAASSRYSACSLPSRLKQLSPA